MAKLIDKFELVKAVRESRKNNTHTDGSIARNHDMEHCHFLSLISRQETVTEAEIRNKAIDEFAEKLKCFIASQVDCVDGILPVDYCCEVFQSEVDEIAEQLKEVK